MKLNVEGYFFFKKNINQEKNKNIAIKRMRIKNELKKQMQ
jgi:hypothetical protein